MDEEKNSGSGLQSIQNAANKAKAAAKAAVAAGKAAAKAAAGDVAGAAKDILTNPELLKAIICAIVILSMILVLPFFLIGAILVAVLNALAEHWNEERTESAIDSNGSTWYYNSMVIPDAFLTLLETGGDGLQWLWSKFEHWVGWDDDEDADDRGFDGEDLEKTVDAVKDTESLTGDDGALWTRIDMIEGRVARRGEQMEALIDVANIQGLWGAFVTHVANVMKNPFLFNGFTYSVNVNREVFDLTDIQALKIYAAYAVQHDCSLADADINDLIDYCGWYNGFNIFEWESVMEDEECLMYGSLADNNDGQSIYNTNSSTTLGEGFDESWCGEDGTVETEAIEAANEWISEYSYDLWDLPLPAWSGSCAPQWFYEEIAQIEEYNENNESPVYLFTFPKLTSGVTFGLIDKLYTCTDISVTVKRIEEEANYSGWRGVAADIYSEWITSWWDDRYGDQSGASDKLRGSYFRNDGEHGFIAYTTTARKYYYLYNTDTGAATAVKQVGEAYQSEEPYISGTREPNPDYVPNKGTPVKFSGLTAETKYELYESDDEEIDDSDTCVDSFTTFCDECEVAWRIDFSVNIECSAISVDQLVYGVLGLWPGSLNDTMEKDGVEYAKGHTGNENLVRYWTDTGIDSDGNVVTMEFERLSGYQVEAYEDTVRMLAAEDVMDIPVANMFGTYNQNYGSDMVSMARQEYEYYKENGLYEGSRYWNMAYEAGGTNCVYSASTAWCVVFVETCAWQCGYIGEGKAWGDMKNDYGIWPLNCSGIRNELVNEGNGVFYESDYKPVPGDLIYFGGTSSFSTVQHIGIVTESRPDGTIQVIHGNYSRRVTLTELDSYQDGTRMGSQVICGYVHPNYPQKIFSELVYLSQGPKEVKPDNTARYVTATMKPIGGDPYEFSVLIAGKGRFRSDQLMAVIVALEKNTDLDLTALKAALPSRDDNAIIEAWNELCSGPTASQFEEALDEILLTEFVNPIAEAVEAKTGFNWMKTEVRQNILYSIVTTSSQIPALQTVLSNLCSGLTDDCTDGALLQTLNKNDNKTTYLYDTLMASASSLWPREPRELQEWWAESCQRTLEETQEQWNESGAQYGDPSSPVEDQIYYFLTYSMGLNSAAACGILANVEAECNFNLATVGDSGSAFGICQWRGSRWKGCKAYCAELGLDHNTVQGQVEWMRRELERKYSDVLDYLLSVPNTAEGAAAAADYFCRHYEIPANMDSQAASRGSRAQNYFWPMYD